MFLKFCDPSSLFNRNKGSNKNYYTEIRKRTVKQKKSTSYLFFFFLGGGGGGGVLLNVKNNYEKLLVEVDKFIAPLWMGL